MAEAARQLQLVHLTTLPETRSFIETTQHLHPGIGDAVMPICTNGDAPKYEETPEKAAPGDCYPRDPRGPGEIIESARRDIISLKTLVCTTKSLIYPEMLE